MKLKLQPICATEEQVNAEKDRRLEMGFTFNGKRYQARSMDQTNLTGAATAANLAVASGAQPGDFRWANPDSDFQWIAADNTRISMDAHTVIALGLTAIKFVAATTMAARNLKDTILAGGYIADATDDRYWVDA